MISPFKLIIINIFFLFFLSLFVYIFKRLFPKKKINPLFLLLLLSLGTSISIFRIGSYESGDFNIHVYRSVEFYKNLLEGFILPSWAGDLNASYGLPLFMFNYTFPYYATSFFHLLGFSFIDSLKVFLCINLILTSLFSYILGLKIFNKNKMNAFIFGIFYSFFPYHLISVHFKITLGEVSSYTLLPLFFYYIFLINETKKNKYLIYSSLIYFFIFISHIFIAILLIPLLFSYIFFNGKNKIKNLLNFSFILIFSLIASSYQWLPSIIFKSYLYITHIKIDLDKVFFPSLSDLLYSPWRYGLLFQGPNGEISYLLGYMQIALIILSLVFIFKRKFTNNEKGQIYFWLIFFFLYLSLLLPQSKIFWNLIPILGGSGPHRLLIILGLITAFISSITLSKIKNLKIIYLIILFVIGSTILNWGQRTVIPQINDEYIMKTLPLSTHKIDNHFYAATIYQNPNKLWENTVPDKPLKPNKLISYRVIKRSQNEHVYKISVNKNTILSENTLYFPGWNVYANNIKLKTYPNKNGHITFNINKGNFTVLIKYEDILYISLAKKISLFLITLSLLIIIFIKIKSSRGLNKH